MSVKKRKKLSPSKIIITTGEGLTQSQVSGKVSGVNYLNAIIHLIRDTEILTGINAKVHLATVAEFFGYRIIPMERNPTMNASLSEKTANEDEE